MTGEFDARSEDSSGILPTQVILGARWDGDTSGPRALMLAVLEDALRCIERGSRRRTFYARRLAADAEGWLRSDRRDWPFSFLNVCDVLGFQPDAVRNRSLRTRIASSGMGRVRLRGRGRARMHATTVASEAPARIATGGTR